METNHVEKVLFLVFSVHLLSQFYNHMGSKTLRIIQKNPQFTLHEPTYAAIPPVEDVYDQLIDLKNFSFLVNPRLCNEHREGILLLIIVESEPKNFRNRDIIRETWGKETDSVKVVFLMGVVADVAVSVHVRKESVLHRDIVQGNFVDSYRNVTYKHVMGLKWAAHHCSAAKYVLKTEDDVMIHIEMLVHFLVRDFSPWGALNLILCSKRIGVAVVRNSSDKAVSYEEYERKTYPDYCAGFAILYSQDVVRRLVQVSIDKRYFWRGDVMVTGILAQNASVPRSHFPMSEIGKPGSKYAGQWLVHHDLLVKEMPLLWKERHIRHG